MKANIGIRRRLAPLLDNDRNQIELFTALLLSLPGSPVLYYGDEIGMGDNIWLGDRDGVRTPMQWTPDRNAGFSTLRPGPALPAGRSWTRSTATRSPTSRPSCANSSSLLHWTRRMIEVRKQNPAFGLGTFSDLGGSNPSVLSFVRDFGDDIVLCVNNLSRFPQPVELDLRRWEGATPSSCSAASRFPRDRRAALPADPRRPRLLLVPAAASREEDGRPTSPPRRRRSRGPSTALRPARCCLGASQRWFAGKGRTVQVTAVDRVGWLTERRPGAATSARRRSATPTTTHRDLPAAAGATAGAGRPGLARARRRDDRRRRRRPAWSTTRCTTRR